MDRSSVFRQTSLLVCLPDLMQLHCPIHMYIRTLEAEMYHSIRTIQEPEFISPSCSFKTSQIEKKRKHELNIKQVTECNHKLNIIKVIQQMCEGRKNCELQLSQLIPNLTQCFEDNSSLLVKYQCLPDKKKLSMDLRKSMNVHMNSKTTELLHKNQDPYIPSFNPSILQSSLIGFGSGLFILLCILFIVILIYRKYNNKHTEMKSQHASKSNECSTICFSHSNDDWSTINSKGLHMTSITEIPLPNDIKFLCPICKLPTNPCSMITDLHKYHNENCQCHINSNKVGNLNICALHHETFDSKPCCMTGHHHDNSSDLYTMKIITPTLNQSPVS
ncbi:hypothetical protein Smp_176240 [Schistosoma mansoni]|uniref:hypothetical protein n=1 Tax=Schistosoma mansoni TaxID=6183 RepID=UPI00022C828E|nr:hypothetical protein Smp_176240 [Schistosoma mansoni]|eukprot:XP_018647188.1 hypothetical protein Smp_176240 [Schistosoma mansoni]